MKARSRPFYGIVIHSLSFSLSLSVLRLAWRWLLRVEICRYKFLKINKVVVLEYILLFNYNFTVYGRVNWSQILEMCSAKPWSSVGSDRLNSDNNH
jgi:hypothetical protein